MTQHHRVPFHSRSFGSSRAPRNARSLDAGGGTRVDGVVGWIMYCLVHFKGSAARRLAALNSHAAPHAACFRLLAQLILCSSVSMP
mgnify:CR=1 FL=1